MSFEVLDLNTLATIATVVVAALALIVSAKATSVETTKSMFDFYPRYEAYVRGFEGTTNPKQLVIDMANLLSFMETSAQVHNRRRGPADVREIIESVLTDVLAGFHGRVDLRATMENYQLHKRSFRELLKFERRHRSIIKRKAQKIPHTIWTSLDEEREFAHSD
jgi:hypothetical protein